jgi:hypothetical protein
VAQGVGPEFKPQYCQKKKENQQRLNIVNMCWIVQATCRVAGYFNQGGYQWPRPVILATWEAESRSIEA